MFKRVTRKMSQEARMFMDALFKKLHDELKEKYKFFPRLVGSISYNTGLLIDGKYDLDYQILLTKNSKEYKTNGNLEANDVHKAFKGALDSYFKTKCIKGKVEESTTALTLILEEKNYSVDIVLIRYLPENKEIIRRKNNDKTTINDYTWNQLEKCNDAYKKFNKMSNEKKEEVIEKYILPAKEKEKKKEEWDATKKTSSQVFIEEVNNYVLRRNDR